jgi:drug/metabolite transporter (DMT)-like permease
LLVPVSGIVSSAVVLGETFTLIELLSLCLVFAGLSMVVMEARLSSFLTPKWNRIRKRLAG